MQKPKFFNFATACLDELLLISHIKHGCDIGSVTCLIPCCACQHQGVVVREYVNPRQLFKCQPQFSRKRLKNSFNDICQSTGRYLWMTRRNHSQHNTWEEVSNSIYSSSSVGVGISICHLRILHWKGIVEFVYVKYYPPFALIPLESDWRDM